MNVVPSSLTGRDDSPGTAEFVNSRTLDASEERVPALRQYLRIVTRWRFVILGILAICVVLGLIVTLLMTPKYTAAATIEISRESDRVTDLRGVQREAGAADQEFYQTQYGLLRARSLSERVALQLHLVDDEKFFELFRVSARNPALQLSDGRYPGSGRAERQRIAGEILLDHLVIEPTRLSRLVEIRFTSPDPQFSAKVANAWGENFIQANLERKVQATSYGRNMIQRQLTGLKAKLDESQRQLVNYATAEQIINLPTSTGDGRGGERSIVSDDLTALNSELAQATADRIQAQARSQQIRRTGIPTESLNNPAINGLRQKRAELAADYQRLMAQFEPAYPAAVAIKSQIDQIDRSIKGEEARVSGSLQSDSSAAVQRETSLQAKVDQLKSKYLDLRRRSIQYNIYQQEVDTNRVLYDGLLQRFKEIGVAAGVGVNNVSIVDPAAVPNRPSSPRLLLNLAIAVLAGLGLGALAAFALEQMDEAIADPTEIERRLGLPLLGSVPKVIDETPKEALLDRKSDLFDAYLAVLTNLTFTTEHGVPRSFAITSTRPAEGKSTTALALATTLARSQRRVILVDGDMRSPSVHHLGGVGHERGLSNFLAGEEQIDALVFPMPELGFTAMSAGPIPPNAAELLSGNRLSVLIERLLETYDHVVIDAPPVMGLADAPLIASRVEGIIYAVESHGIRSSLVKTALARLSSANAHILGGVLTKFEARKGRYGYEYGYGYGRGDDSDRVKAARGG
jgi:capsular exopolysaccharide synthesis family protein